MYQKPGYEELQKRIEKLEEETAKYRSLADFKALVEKSPDLIARFDKSLHHLYVNPSVLNATGLSFNDYIGKSNRELGMPENVLELWESALKSVFENGQEKEIEFNYKTPEGDRTFHSHFIPECYKAGVDETFLGITRDITELKQAEETIRKSEEKYRSFVENFQGIAFKGYENFSADFYTGKVKEITGYSENDFVSGRINYNQLIHPEDKERVQVEIKNFSSSSKKATQREYRIIDKNGNTHWIQDNIQKLYNEDKKMNGVLGTQIDITDRKQMEKTLQESKELYSTIFDNNPAAIAMSKNSDNKLIEINDAWLDMTGYTRDEVIGHTSLDLNLWVDPGQRDRFAQKLSRRERVREEVQIRRKSGDITPFKILFEFLTLIFLLQNIIHSFCNIFLISSQIS